MAKPSQQGHQGGQKQSATVNLRLRESHFRRFLRFNRFLITEMEGGKLFQCAFVVDGNVELCRYIGFISGPDLAQSGKAMSTYISQLDAVPESSVRWDQNVLWFAPNREQMDMVRAIQASRSGDEAELSFYTHSNRVVFCKSREAAGTSKTLSVPTDALALITSTAQVHFAFLVALFGDAISTVA